MVERKVKLMSVQASPVVKKMPIVLAMALGCDQKKASIQPARAPTSHSDSPPTRMTICAARSAQVGQSFCTGRRRRRRAAGFAPLVRRQIETANGANTGDPERSSIAPRGRGSGSLVDRLGRRRIDLNSPRQRSLIARNSGVSALVRMRGRGNATGRVSMMRPARAHHVDLVGEVDCLLDVMGDEQYGLAKSPQSRISHSCICSLVWASSAPNGSSSRMTSVSNRSVRNSAARWRMPPESEFG